MSTPNEQQTEYWNEDAGRRWVEYQERLDPRLERAGMVAMEAAQVSEGEAVLDVGCGCGGSSLEIARRVGVSGRVLGVDISEQMLARARERAKSAGLENLKFVRADAQTHNFDQGAFDLAFSRFGVMFFENPVAAFANIRRALRPGGRVGFLCWRPAQENPWILVPMMAAAQHVEMPPPPAPDEPGPFSFGDPDRVRGILSEAGFEQTSIAPYDESEPFERTAEEAVEFLQHIGPLSRLLADATPEKKQAVLEAVRKSLEPFAGPDGVATPRAMWIVQAVNPG